MGTGSEQERVFAAVRLQGDALQKMSEWSHSMQTRYLFRKWTYAEDFHITLQFFGDVNRTALPDLHQALQTAAQQTQPFLLELGAADYFGIAERPRVLWITPKGELQPLHELQQRIQQNTEPLGYRAEQRPYRPHITVARKYGDEQSFPPLNSLEMPASSSWLVDEIVLYHTRLGQQPMYEPASVFSLAKI